MIKGVLIVDMGGATSPKELKVFLSRMFNDPSILPFGKIGRCLLSMIISNTRYKKSWKKYELIGGSPIIEATHQIQLALQKELGSAFVVKKAFSYSSPLIEESLYSFIKEGILDVTIIPMYPQASFSTTSSVERDVKKIASVNKDLKINFVNEFYKWEAFIDFWVNLISNHIVKQNLNKPYLLFSAHSIPQYLADKGDTYPKSIEASSKLIADKLTLDFEFSYQSRMKGKWIGPDTKDKLTELAKSGESQIIIIPISFINENLETLYDLDQDIIPFAQNELSIKNISRVKIPQADELFIKLLIEIVKTNN
jgi:ferrochelatase